MYSFEYVFFNPIYGNGNFITHSWVFDSYCKLTSKMLHKYFIEPHWNKWKWHCNSIFFVNWVIKKQLTELILVKWINTCDNYICSWIWFDHCVKNNVYLTTIIDHYHDKCESSCEHKTCVVMSTFYEDSLKPFIK